MRVARRTLATSVAVLVAATVASVAYRLRHPPVRVHVQPPVAFPSGAGDYRLVTFTRGQAQWTASVARLRAGRYALALAAAPDDVEAGTRGTWIQPAAADAGALVAVNGGYFDDRGRPLGLRVAGGRETSPLLPNRPPLSAILHALPDGNAQITPVATPLPGNPETAIQSGPMLVDPGGRPGIRSDTGATARRTVVATTADGDLLLIVTSPVTLANLADVLVTSPASFGVNHVDRALNLDGGPSTALAVRTPAAHVWTPPTGPVRDALLVLPRR